MKSVLLLGSGFVAGPCAEYILRRPDNRLTIASRREEHARRLADSLEDSLLDRVRVAVVDVEQEDGRLEQLVGEHDVTVSLVPYVHHPRVIRAAIQHRRNVVTTSYISPAMAAMHNDAISANIVVMNECGLDPGIDHLYAVKTIHDIHCHRASLDHFVSYCGGLPAPECSNNPLGYKFSWSSRGVLLALRNTAKFVQDGKDVEIPGSQLMNTAKPIYTGYPAFAFVGYPNRDSTPYRERYNIPEAKTILRGTLRYQGFPKFIQALVNIGLLDDTPRDSLLPTAKPLTWREFMSSILGLSASSSTQSLTDALVKKANLNDSSEFSPDDRQNILVGFRWLGLLVDTPVSLSKTPLDALCALLESKMMYAPSERDMVMLQHRFDVSFPDGSKQTRFATLLEFGDPNGPSAMAKTVGVPCGIAVQLILDGVVTTKGVVAPMTMDICGPMIKALEKEGIRMVEEVLE